MNNHGSQKVLQWKLDIQHYDAIIEHVAGVTNTLADVFSRLVETDIMVEVNHVMILTCSAMPWDIIRRHHEWLCAHNGFDRTLDPNDTATPGGNVGHSMASTTIQPDMSKDGSASQGDSVVAFCPVDTKANAENCAGHYRSHGYIKGFDIHSRRHRYIH